MTPGGRYGHATRVRFSPEAVLLSHAEIRQFFAHPEIEDETRWQAIAQTPECPQWWRHMGDIMPANPDHSPQTTIFREVFHLD